jgi:HEAT repeat protein
MAVTMEQVRAALDPDEPDYERAAELGTEALPHLRELVVSAEPMLASKATYLAGRISADESIEILREAGRSDDPVLRVAAAGAARELPGETKDGILIELLNDDDRGVRSVALKSVGPEPSKDLRTRIEELSEADRDPRIRDASAAILRRTTRQ